MANPVTEVLLTELFRTPAAQSPQERPPQERPRYDGSDRIGPGIRDAGIPLYDEPASPALAAMMSSPFVTDTLMPLMSSMGGVEEVPIRYFGNLDNRYNLSGGILPSQDTRFAPDTVAVMNALLSMPAFNPGRAGQNPGDVFREVMMHELGHVLQNAPQNNLMQQGGINEWGRHEEGATAFASALGTILAAADPAMGYTREADGSLPRELRQGAVADYFLGMDRQGRRSRTEPGTMGTIMSRMMQDILQDELFRDHPLNQSPPAASGDETTAGADQPGFFERLLGRVRNEKAEEEAGDLFRGLLVDFLQRFKKEPNK